MYIDNVGSQLVDGAYPCNISGPEGATGLDGTQIYVNYYDIASDDTPLKGPVGLTEFILGAHVAAEINNIPPMLFNGKEYTYMEILKTGVVSFQIYDDTVLENYNAGHPAIPCLFINVDPGNSLQRIYYGLEDGDTQFRLRYEGTNAPDGVVGSPNIVWELTYYYNTPGQFDIVYGEITPVDGTPTPALNADSSGQGYLGQFDGLSNTAFRINPAERLVGTVDIFGDGFQSGIQNGILYVDIEPFFPLVVNNDDPTTVIVNCPTLFTIDSYNSLVFEGTGDNEIRTTPFNADLDSNYYGNISVNMPAILNNVNLLNVPTYNSSAIPDGPEFLVWVDENNFLRVL